MFSGRDLGRAEAFSDAVVAVAVTVLALFAPQVALWSMWLVIPLRLLAQQDGPVRSASRRVR